MILLPAGLEVIKVFEGFSSIVYRDAVGIPTIGYGSTYDNQARPITMDASPIDETTAETYLAFGIRWAERCVCKLIHVPLTDAMYSALVSLIYNIGSGNFQRSTLRMKLNRGQYEDAADEFPKWRRAGGRILAGLVRRRAVEQALFLRA
jgi:lysozyme